MVLGLCFFLQMIAFFAPNAAFLLDMSSLVCAVSLDADRSTTITMAITTTKASIPAIIGTASKEIDDNDDDPPV